MFFSEYGYRPHVTGVFGNRKRRFSNTLSRVETFENGDVSWRKRRFSNTMTSYLGSRLALPHTRLENAACGRRFFLNTAGKCLRFQKYLATCGRSNTIRKRYVWTQLSFKYGEKNLRFRQYPATYGRSLNDD